MYLSYFTLFIALSISLVAAWYSIIGLTAIFAAAAIPIIVMGGILEVAKVTITVWLHEYWHRCRWLMKLYLVPAVVVLMLITSMGIFGFLSKAHLDQAVPTGDVVAQVSLIDEKINNERETIANARSLLTQLDQAVTALGSAPDREVNGKVTSSAERALQVRRQQTQDRASLTKTIEDAQARIVTLQEQKAPIAAELRKVEAEVGPIKYVAALIYGDNPDANLLERAVRWMIILLVIVFDPLAIMMVLAATESLRWERDARRPQVEPADETTAVPDSGPVEIPPPPMLFQDPGEHPGDMLEDQPAPVQEEIALPEQAPVKQVYLDQPWVHFSGLEPRVYQRPNIADYDAWFEVDRDEGESPQLKSAIKAWKADNPQDTIKNQRHLLAKGMIDELPWMAYLRRPMPASGFGTVFPGQAGKGDTWVRTDFLPNRVYKFNGQQWIEVDKSQNDAYTYDMAYIDNLIDRLGSGEYDPELLNDQEREQVAQRLSQRSDR